MLFANTREYLFTLRIYYFYLKSAARFIQFQARREELGYANPATDPQVDLWQALQMRRSTLFTSVTATAYHVKSDIPCSK